MITTDISRQEPEREILSAITDNIFSGGGEKIFNGNLIISGNYSGRIFVKGTLTLGDNSSVTGEIVADKLIMFGMFKGKARVKNLAVFHKTASFSGNLTAEEAEVYKGCTISGTRSIARIIEKSAISEKPVMSARSVMAERSLIAERPDSGENTGCYNVLAEAFASKAQNDYAFMPLWG
jgi:cytoskeletal protein CcmA (bactofilin family)